MFEKEAEEYANKNKTRGGSSSFGDITNYHDLRQGFIAGAEFGYNKANEWHFVKDGDLPKNENRVWLYFGVDDYNDGQFIRGRFWCGYCGWFDIDAVIAWKEIVLPELKESK